MATYEHTELATSLTALGKAPDDDEAFREWLLAQQHLRLITDVDSAPESILHAAGRSILIKGFLLPLSALETINRTDWFSWGFHDIRNVAHYDYVDPAFDDAFPDDAHLIVEQMTHLTGCSAFAKAVPLVYNRYFDDVSDPTTRSLELLQSFAHVLGVNWLPQQHAYCRVDERGDYDSIVSVTNADIQLVTCQRSFLEEYLVATESVLLTCFNFSLYRSGGLLSPRQRDIQHTRHDMTDDFGYDEWFVESNSNKVRGVGIVRPSYTVAQAITSIDRRWRRGRDADEGVEFLIHDLRYKRLLLTTTARGGSTNYFEAVEGLPFELSPAFFRSEVLQKYTADRDKYTVTDRDIHCRGAWGLRGYGINDAGQVIAYLCYLGDLPLEEQEYWKLYNEMPKAGLPASMIASDFRGNVPEATASQRMRYLLQQWVWRDVQWWRSGSEGIEESTTGPHSNSREDWLRAIQSTAQLVIEGFQIRAIRERLEGEGTSFERDERSIVLLERMCKVHKSDDGEGFDGLRSLWELRNAGGMSHRSSDGGRGIAERVLVEHRTFTAHYEMLCNRLTSELEVIQATFES